MSHELNHLLPSKNLKKITISATFWGDLITNVILFISLLVIFIPVPTGVMTQDERNCDHKTGKTSKRENHFCMSRLTLWHPLAIYSLVFANNVFPLDRACKLNSRPWLFQKIKYPCLPNLILLLGNDKLIKRENVREQCMPECLTN